MNQMVREFFLSISFEDLLQRETYNMHRKPLHPDVIDISENAREKRMQYFNLWRENSVVSRGEIEFLRVSDCEIDDLLFRQEDENGSLLISEYNINFGSQLALSS